VVLTVVGIASLYTFHSRFQNLPGVTGNIASRHAVVKGAQ
jgi:hypothetical protein